MYNSATTRRTFFTAIRAFCLPGLAARRTPKFLKQNSSERTTGAEYDPQRNANGRPKCGYARTFSPEEHRADHYTR